jgi:hypothetical protein
VAINASFRGKDGWCIPSLFWTNTKGIFKDTDTLFVTGLARYDKSAALVATTVRMPPNKGIAVGTNVLGSSYHACKTGSYNLGNGNRSYIVF